MDRDRNIGTETDFDNDTDIATEEEKSQRKQIYSDRHTQRSRQRSI